MNTVFAHQIAEDDPIIEDLVASLATLAGMGTKVVASYLHDIGVRGERCHWAACPVARYLRNVLGVPRAEVTDFATVWPVSGGMVSCELPTSVADFVTQFDNGDFPSLIDPAGPTPEEKWTHTHDA